MGIDEAIKVTGPMKVNRVLSSAADDIFDA